MVGILSHCSQAHLLNDNLNQFGSIAIDDVPTKILGDGLLGRYQIIYQQLNLCAISRILKYYTIQPDEDLVRWESNPNVRPTWTACTPSGVQGATLTYCKRAKVSFCR